MFTHVPRALLAAGTFALASPAAAQLSDPPGDFLPSYTGPHNPDLDVRSIRFEFDNRSTFRFFSTSAGAIGTTPGAPFVWGVNRGAGVANFASLGLPDIRFDAVVILVPNGTSFVFDLLSGVQTNLAAGAVAFSGNRLEAFVPLGLLTPRGFDPRRYTANLWPRSELILEDPYISDFAPNTTNLAVVVTPEPGTWALLATGLVGVVGVARRRQRVG